MKITDKFTKSTDKKNKEEEENYLSTHQASSFSSKITKLLHRENLSSNWSGKTKQSSKLFTSSTEQDP
jgi:hypothetical protein